MANVSIKFNNKDYLLSCDPGQEESLKELIKEDFPTFERPQKTISGISSCGRSVNL